MAIYHLSAQVIGRSAGRSSVAAAAYRAGERITDERTGHVHDYTKRQDIEREIITPEGAPAWMQERARLWNAVEAVEKRKDAQVARELNIALPKELTPEQQREMVHRYVKEEMVSKGMVADVAIHRNDPNNPHAHIMTTMRDVSPEGFGTKNREWNRTEQLEEWREKWQEHTNRELERAGSQERIDHRSLEAQGQDRLPTVHEGPDVRAMEEKGTRTEVGDINRGVREYNDNLIDFQRAKAEIAERKFGDVAREHDADRQASGVWDDRRRIIVSELERERGKSINEPGARRSLENSEKWERVLMARIEENRQKMDIGKNRWDVLKRPSASAKYWSEAAARHQTFRGIVAQVISRREASRAIYAARRSSEANGLLRRAEHQTGRTVEQARKEYFTTRKAIERDTARLSQAQGKTGQWREAVKGFSEARERGTAKLEDLEFSRGRHENRAESARQALADPRPRPEGERAALQWRQAQGEREGEMLRGEAERVARGIPSTRTLEAHRERLRSGDWTPEESRAVLAADRTNPEPLRLGQGRQQNETYGTGRELRELKELIDTRTSDLKAMESYKRELHTRWREWKALDDAYKPHESWLSKNVNQRFSPSARTAEEQARQVRDQAYERYTQTMYHERHFRRTNTFDSATNQYREISPVDQQYPPKIGGYRNWKEAESDWAAKGNAWTAELKAAQERLPAVTERHRVTDEALWTRNNVIGRTVQRHYNSEPVVQRYEERLRSRLWKPSEAKAAREVEAAAGGRPFTHKLADLDHNSAKALNGLMREERLGPYREGRNAGTMPRNKAMDKELRDTWRGIREERDPAFKRLLDGLEYGRYVPGRERVRVRFDTRDY